MKPRMDDYQKGDVTRGGKIDAILGANKDVIVYLSGSCSLRWETTDQYQNPQMGDILKVFQKWNARIDGCVWWRRSLRGCKTMLGHILYSAMRDPTQNDLATLFEKSVEEIEPRLQIQLRVNYVLAATTIAIVAGSLALVSYNYFQEQSLLAASGGILGTLLSIYSRTGSLEFNETATALRSILDAFLRVGYGFAAGLVIYVLVRANIVGGLFGGTSFGILAVAIVGGFSERKIAGILEAINP